MDFLRLLEGIRNPVLDSFFQWITYFGQEICILAVICLFYWCLDKKFAYRLGFIYFSAGLCIQTLKITFRIPRPWILDPEFHPVASAVPAATGYSFPSGHTQGGTCLFVPLALRSRKFWQKCLCILMFLAIGFSRMYLGVHTPKDVFTAMAVSLFFYSNHLEIRRQSAGRKQVYENDFRHSSHPFLPDCVLRASFVSSEYH